MEHEGQVLADKKQLRLKEIDKIFKKTSKQTEQPHTRKRNNSASTNSKGEHINKNTKLESQKAKRMQAEEKEYLKVEDLEQLRMQVASGDIEGLVLENWIMCDKCGKWRKITKGMCILIIGMNELIN